MDQHLDLNLVRVFVAIYEARSVTGAAERLDLSQATISYSLSKLRHIYGQHLFTRNARGLSPTFAAEQLYQTFSQSLSQIDGTLDALTGFDPATARRRFRLATSDVGTIYFTPLLLAQLQKTAPGVELEIVPLDGTAIVQEFMTGKVDAAVGILPTARPYLRSSLLFSERYVCLFSEAHAGAVGRRVDLEVFVKGRHVRVEGSPGGDTLVDEALRERGLTRNVAVSVPQYAVVPLLITECNLFAVLPARPARLFASGAPLRWAELPFSVPRFEVRLYWHPRDETSAVSKWFRTQIEVATGTRTSGPSPSECSADHSEAMEALPAAGDGVYRLIRAE